MDTGLPKYRVMDIEKVTIAGHPAKVFKAFKLTERGYVFTGEFQAPVRTANKNLVNFILED